MPLDKILYIESNLHKLKFFVLEGEKKEYQMYGKLDKVSEDMRNYGFTRIHQSFLVNMKYVIGVKRYTARLTDGTEISISKKPICFLSHGKFYVISCLSESFQKGRERSDESIIYPRCLR